MKFMTTTTALIASLCTGITTAAPFVTEAKRDVFVPPVTYPHAGTVWYSGQTHNVTWDTSFAPVNITNSKGIILLRFENIESPVILGSGFDIRKGRTEIVVPRVFTGSNYSLVLFGDSGNFSPTFEIINNIDNGL